MDRKIKILMLLTSMSICYYSVAQQSYVPADENIKAREWFQDAKFGLFVHWGVYSVLANNEWVMHLRPISVEDYEKLSAFFNPELFDAEQWVAMVKDAGMKYITITSKHHDGFSMYDSKVSDYDIVDRTPYGKDVLKQLTDECHKQGIKIFFYYSHLDWHHTDYYPLGRESKRPEGGDWYKYLDYVDAQLTELLTNYGEIAGIWFDGSWDKKNGDWRFEQTYQLIHDLQPACLVGNNHHHEPIPGEDFQMFEKDLPGNNTSGFSDGSTVGQLPLETCETMNGSWGYSFQDKKYKSTRDLIQMLVKAAGYNANFLLNVGSMPNGLIQPEFTTRLAEIGQWTKKYGETIYGTRGGMITPRDWGVTTQKDNLLYLHILSLKDEALMIPKINKKIKKVYFYDDRSNIRYKVNEYGYILPIPEKKKKDPDTIIVMELE